MTTLALALSACGGGDSYTPTVTTTTVADDFPIVTNSESLATMRRGEATVTGQRLVYGDTWMYEWVNKTAGTGYYSTHYITALDKTTQLYSRAVTFSDNQPYQTQNYGSANQLTSLGYDNTLCRYDPQTRSPFPRRPYVNGSVWTYVWSESCINGTLATVVNKTISGKVVSISEPITLGLLGQGGTVNGSTTQRTFDTVKYTATRTETTSAGTWTYADTCWHDKAQDRTVQCNTSASFVPAGGTAVTQRYDQEQRLAFVREVRTKSPVLVTDGASTVAMFAGRWNFKMVGLGGTVTCPTMSVSLTGQISGNCVKVVITTPDPLNPTAQVRTDVPFTVSGFIDRRAVTTQNPGEAAVTRTIDALSVVADTGPSDLSMTGEMFSPIAGSGDWVGAGTTSGTKATGTWSAQHL
jgi:hypothetical protein